jgi:hypothetical protein
MMTLFSFGGIMSFENVPIVRLTVQKMAFAMDRALTEYECVKDEQIKEAIAKACEPARIQEILDHALRIEVDRAVNESVKQFFGYGDGRKYIVDRVTQKLKESLKEERKNSNVDERDVITREQLDRLSVRARKVLMRNEFDLFSQVNEDDLAECRNCGSSTIIEIMRWVKSEAEILSKGEQQETPKSEQANGEPVRDGQESIETE